MISTLSTTTTQTAYYMALLKLILVTTSFALGIVLLFGAICLITFYSRHWG